MEYDEFDEWKKTKTTVYEILDDGDFFTCSCPNGLKKYFCKHSIGMAIKFKAYAIPTQLSMCLWQQKGGDTTCLMVTKAAPLKC